MLFDIMNKKEYKKNIKLVGDVMLNNKFFQGMLVGFAIFAVFLNCGFYKNTNNKDETAKYWNNVGKYLKKAIKNYEQNNN